MAAPDIQKDEMPVVSRVEHFDTRTGSLLERVVFNNRALVVLACLFMTLLMAYSVATRIQVNASFEKMLPSSHPYIQNYRDNQDGLKGLGNAIRVVVENTKGDIFDPEFLKTLQQINDQLFLTPGVDRAWMRSIWSPGVRWTEITEEGFRGGPVMPDSYDGSPEAIAQLKQNIQRAGITGIYVGNDFKSAMLFVPLLDKEPSLNSNEPKKLDYHRLSGVLEQDIRIKYELAKKVESIASANQTTGIKVRIIGFAKLVGDLIDGLIQVMTYFAIATVIAALILFFYTRCLRSTFLVLGCSMVAVVWQIGIISLLGYEVDPFSILVPFLVFAIGVSHGAQKMNGIMQDIGRGTHRLVAARYTFRRLFMAGLTALLADAVGFAVLMLIDIPVIQDLAVTASIGVAVLIFTNLLLVPVLLSYVGVNPKAAERSLRSLETPKRGALERCWAILERFTERRWAITMLVGAALLTVLGFQVSLQLKIGDLDPGAPELRKDSRYNLDNAYITSHYALSSDQFAVIVKTPKGQCGKYDTLIHIDRLAWELRQLPGVQATIALPDVLRRTTAGVNEGHPKWLTLPRNQQMLNFGLNQAVSNNPDLFDISCSITRVTAYLSDHKSDTLEQVVAAVESFSERHNTPELQFLMAAGSAGIEAATNIVVKDANRKMLFLVYGAVALLCLITFRSWRAVLVALLPLVMTSILCEALMVGLGMGVKVATLPVIALGVGIGVDYALYLLSVQLYQQRLGQSLRESYRQALQFTGRVVALVGITLAAGVITWAWSPIKFQADMGILLTFMFLWNMLGALLLIPALSHFLLRDPQREKQLSEKPLQAVS